MANGSPARPRTSGVFSGLLLILFGFLLLLHNYGHLQLGAIFRHWWPLIFIFWGAAKLYERTVAQRQGRSSGWITPGEVFLVLALLTVVGLVVAYDSTKDELGNIGINVGDSHSFDFDVAPQTLPANAHVTIRGGRGNITVRSSDDQTIRVTGQKQVRAWTNEEAEKHSHQMSVAISDHGGGSFEIVPTGFDLSDSRMAVDMDVVLSKKTVLTV